MVPDVSCTDPADFARQALDVPRIWRNDGHQTAAPLSDQAEVEAEADSWAELWAEGKEHMCIVDPTESPPLEPIMPDALLQAALTFPPGTGLGSDNFSPRAICRLSREAVRALCTLVHAFELLGDWATVLRLVLIVLLPKPDGGRRPIGLFPSIIRLWMRARAAVVRSWDLTHSRPSIYG